MSKPKMGGTTWRITNRSTGEERHVGLAAYWEVDRDPISDNYTPEETPARDLLEVWLSEVRDGASSQLVPIYWSVIGPNIFENMPFQYAHGGGPAAPLEDFLSFYSWPVSSTTGKPLNWVTLPVADKRWNGKQSDKGGFIQEATGWKPAILQPFVHIPTLAATRQ